MFRVFYIQCWSPLSCGMLVYMYRLVTSIDTSIVSFTTFALSIKFRKSVVFKVWFLNFNSNRLKEVVNNWRDSFCWAITARYDWPSDRVWFLNLSKGMENWNFVADLASGIAISLSFHKYSYHGNYMVRGTLRHWLAVIANIGTRHFRSVTRVHIIRSLLKAVECLTFS